MSLSDTLAQERRARLAAERLLELKQAELFEANRKLSQHARVLSDEIIVKREETEVLRDENARTKEDRDRAHHAALIAERRLWESIETVQDGFAVFDPSEVLIAANSAYLQVFGGLEAVRPGITYPEIVRLAVEEGIVDIGPLSRETFVEKALERWRAPVRKPHVMRLWNDQFVKLVDRRSADGDMVCVGLNITASIRYEERLKKARFRAEAATRAKSAFLANMSHELRTPMNGMLGMADLIGETALTEEQSLYIETIKSSGGALLQLINDVLDYSKIEASKLALRPEAFDLESCIQDVTRLLQPSAAAKGIELIVDYDMFMPTQFIGDPGRMRQILVNLIGNAVKFTEQGTVIIRAVGVPDGEDGVLRVHLLVEDTGIGIAPQMIEHIFGEFNQIEDERNRQFEGSGLGLAISKQLVHLMGGKIWVDSELGKGSCFGLSLAMEVVADADKQTLPPGIQDAVLLDTVPAHAQVVAKQLMALGVRVTEFATPEALLNAPPTAQVYLVGCKLRDWDVDTFLRALRRQGVMVPVILMVGDAAKMMRHQAEDVVVFQKPMLRSEIWKALKALPAPASEVEIVAKQPSQAVGIARQMRILAAEDNKTNQLVFQKMVKGLDVDLRFVANGQEAVEYYEAFQPDLIFMDISMPQMDGKEATRQIRRLERESGTHVPIVALTAHAMAEDENEILAAGLDHYMTKPLIKAALVERILAEVPDMCRIPVVQGTPKDLRGETASEI